MIAKSRHEHTSLRALIESQVMTTPEVAQALGVTNGRVRQMAGAEGVLTPLSIPCRELMFLRDDIEAEQSRRRGYET